MELGFKSPLFPERNGGARVTSGQGVSEIALGFRQGIVNVAGRCEKKRGERAGVVEREGRKMVIWHLNIGQKK